MTSPLTVTFTGGTAVLQANFLPEIMLDENYNYGCALLDLVIKNVDDLKKVSDVICVDCDIISDSYINGQRSQIIHQFVRSTQLVKDKSIIEIPKHLNYFSVKLKNLRSIRISIVDQKGELLNLNGGDIICRINIKRNISEKIFESC